MNESSYAKLTKVKRSISNLAEKNGNTFLVHHTEKHKEWRKHYVKNNLPNHLWMNDDDLRILSFFMKKCMIVLSPNHINVLCSNYEIKGTICVPSTCQSFGSIARETSTAVKILPVSVSKTSDLSFKKETNNDDSVISLNLGYLLLGGKCCLIPHENDHCKGIILSDAALLQCDEKGPSWPTSASCNVWKNSSVNSSLCSVCEKCNDNAFIQCDLCKCWTHKNCMSDFYNPEIMSERNQHFFCKVCIEKINFRFERYYSSK